MLLPSNDLGDQPAVSAQIIGSHGTEAGWLELLVHGLTFDLHGLTPAKGCFLPGARHFFGLPPSAANDAANGAVEGVAICPGPHLAEGAAMMPVVRVMAALASALAKGRQADAVCWQPSGCWMDTNYFARLITAWHAGGAFPALGLTGINRLADGSVETDGLAFFIGQEMRLEARTSETPAATVKLGIRLIDYLVRNGKVVGQSQLTGPDGELLVAESSRDGRSVFVSRQR